MLLSPIEEGLLTVLSRIHVSLTENSQSLVREGLSLVIWVFISYLACCAILLALVLRAPVIVHGRIIRNSRTAVKVGAAGEGLSWASMSSSPTSPVARSARTPAASPVIVHGRIIRNPRTVVKVGATAKSLL